MKAGTIIREKDKGDFGEVLSLSGTDTEVVVDFKIHGYLPEQLPRKDFEERYEVVCDA